MVVKKWYYDEIWFKAHGKRNDYVFTQKGNIWHRIFGICLMGFVYPMMEKFVSYR
jgi:hypothetical protein